MESSQTMFLKKQDVGKNVVAKKGAFLNEDIGSTNFYFQIVLFVMEIACNVIREFIDKKVLQGVEFQSFLNQIRIKESLFHFYQKSPCCECNTLEKQNKNEKEMRSIKQFKVLYEVNSKANPDHKQFLRVNRCICKYVGKKDIKINDIDICMFIYVVQAANYNMLYGDVINWLEQITDVRNELFHLSDIKKMTPANFNRQWYALSVCVIGIAKTTDETYAIEVQKKIYEMTSIKVSKTTSAIPYERLCREYWENVKSIEFESTQEDELKDLESKVFDRSKLSTDDHEKITKIIHTLKCQVENTTVNVNVKGRQFDKTSPNVDDTDISVLLHLEIPPGWDRDNIIQALSSIRLHGNSAIKINAISCENLNIKINVNSNLLSDQEELKDEIEKTMSRVFKKAGVNIQETSEVNIEFMVPLETVSKETVEDQLLEIEVKLPMTFSIKLPTNIPALDRFPEPHFYPDIVDCILISGLIVVTDYSNNQLLIHNIEGHDNRTIPMNGKPRYMSMISDHQIAVSYIKIELASGKIGNINIVDIKSGHNNTLKENIWEIGCMTYQNGLLFVVIDGKKITALDMKGKIVRSFSCPSLDISNIASDEEKMFLTDSGKNKLYCCDLLGRIIWEFKDDSMKMPSSVTVDGNQNLHITGDRSKNVVMVSPDGQKLNDLLPEDYGVLFPFIIRHDSANDHLLAYNFYSSDACLRDIKTFTGTCDDKI